LNREQRYADLTVQGPERDLPTSPEMIQQLGDSYWPLQAYRELDDALLHLRVNEPEIGLVCVRTKGNIDDVLALDQTLAANQDHWLVHEILLYMARVLRRLDLTAKSFFAIVEPGSCFAGNLLELLLASDRSYMLNDAEAEPTAVSLSTLNASAFPMSNGLTRLESRFLADPEKLAEVLAQTAPLDAEQADEAGLITFVPDEPRLGRRDSRRHRRAYFVVAGCADGYGSVLAFRRSGTMEHKNLRTIDRLAKLDFPATKRSRPGRRVDQLRQANASQVRLSSNLVLSFQFSVFSSE